MFLTKKMQPPMNYMPSMTSGIQMKPSAAEFSINQSNREVDETVHPQSTFVSDNTGLINEDAKLEIQAENHLLAQSSFEYMGLDPRFIQALYVEMGFNRPSLIQAQAIPYIFSQSYLIGLVINRPRRHLIAQAQNGSGKTVCFALGSLGYVNEQLTAPQVLVLAHTRELILQIHEVYSQLCAYTNIRCTCMIKGIPYDPEAQVIIGSIGAVKTAVMKGGLYFNNLVSLVLDEADEMLENRSFSQDTIALLNLFTSYRLPLQILLFSATFNPKVMNFAKRIAPGAVIIKKSTTDLRLNTVLLYAMKTPDFESKCSTLDSIYHLMDIHQTCIFVNTRETADKLGNWLQQKGHMVSVIHGGDMEDTKRRKIIEDFRRGSIKVLVCTDLLARGIDVMDITLVVNFDIPLYDNKVDYVTFLHRSGRTGRMGRKGISITFYEKEGELEGLHVIEDKYDMKVNELSLDNMDVFEKTIKDSLAFSVCFQIVKVATITALGFGAITLIRWLDRKNTNRKEQEENDEFDINKSELSDSEDESSEEELLDDSISIESIVKEDVLYNSFTFTQLRAIFYEFYRRAIETKKDGIRMKAWTENHFKEIFGSIDVNDEEVVRNMFRVWDHDKDGFVNIRDFIHTFAYAQLGSENYRLDYIFESADIAGDSVLTFEEIQRNIRLILQADPETDPDQIEELSILHTRNVFEEMQGDISRGITKNNFLSKGRFLTEEVSLLRTFALALLKGDLPPTN